MDGSYVIVGTSEEQHPLNERENETAPDMFFSTSIPDTENESDINAVMAY